MATEVPSLQQNSEDLGQPISMDDIEKSEEHIQRLQELISNRINRVFQFLNMFYVFQGVIYSSVMSGPKKISCKLKWIPFTLSLLISIFNFLAVLQNIFALQNLYKSLGNAQKIKKNQMDSYYGAEQGEAGKDVDRFWPLIAVSSLTLLPLFVVMGIMLCGCFQIECNGRSR